MELAQIEEWHCTTCASLEGNERLSEHSSLDKQQILDAIEEEHERMVASAKRKWGTEWWKGHPSISPLRGALATWGLTVDDIGVASCHGTSTKLNDKNESDILNSEMEALGRREGNPLFVITQKWLTGHPKGPASAWQTSGAIQAMMTGQIPGNRNLDDVDDDLAKFKHLLYTNRTLDVGKIKAATVTSFGFGQAGGQLLLINPDYFLATLPEESIQSYVTRRDARRTAAYTFHEDVIAGRRKYVEVKTEAPYPNDETKEWLLQRNRRTAMDVPQIEGTFPDAKAKESCFSAFDFLPQAKETATQKTLTQTMQNLMQQMGSSSSVGIDVESVMNPCFGKGDFLDRNYTKQEKEECGHASRSFAGLWAGKEAVVKVLGNAGAELKSAGSALQDIELLRNQDGTIVCHFHGYAAEEAARLGVHKVMVSLSYAENLAVAAAVAN